jgi:hypothetical protein
VGTDLQAPVTGAGGPETTPAEDGDTAGETGERAEETEPAGESRDAD